tara:strand:+ start:81 stop:647 length:567 start_codon:yes stop_codon:yes gene_type:complete
MKIYTRTGDGGITGLFGGDRISKDNPRIGVCGTVDEANCAIGFAVAFAGDELADIVKVLRNIQERLFEIGADLATPIDAPPRQNLRVITIKDVSQLEIFIDQFDDELSPLTSFIIPGGHFCAAGLHLARAVTRRAEREVVAIAKKEEVNTPVIAYLNRLSDLLFTLARTVNVRTNEDETLWLPRSKGE